MDLRRMKTIFIFVLAVLNIIFITVLYNAKNYEAEERRSMTESVSTLLAQNMIYLPEKIDIPASPEINNFYLEKMFGDNRDLARNFLGADFDETGDGGYSSDLGKLVLEGDEFKFVSAKPQELVTDFSEENIEKLCRKEMERLGIFSELYDFNGLNFVDDGIRAIYTAQREEAFFFDAYISFDIGEGGIVAITGRNMISGLKTVHTQTKYFNVLSILPDLVQCGKLEKDVVHTIVSVTPGYYIGKTAESYRNILAIPVWQIATDSGKILYYDARNGQLIEE